MASITLTKHHGLGNDFLIAVSPSMELGADHAIQWCERRRGIGADGLIVAQQHGEDPSSWAMALWNADGSRAELSGNGLRCLGQALVLHHDDGQPTKRFVVQTGAGPREVEILPDRDSDTDQVTVNMGIPIDGPLPYPDWDSVGFPVHQQAGIDVGNPHLVVLVDNPEGIALDKIGPIVEGSYVDGVNIEMIKIEDRNSIRLRVWERGAGLTEACGSGACAAVWAANRWGLVDDHVLVSMPGGAAKIDLVEGAIFLTGPATFVGVVEIEQR